MRKRTMMAVAAAAILVACGSSPTGPDDARGTIVVTAPVEGQVFAMGEPTTISWRCDGCEDLKSRTVEIFLRVGEHSIDPIDEHFLSGSIPWRAGWVRAGITYSPGLYTIHIKSKAVPIDDRSGYIEASGDSGVFKIVR